MFFSRIASKSFFDSFLGALGGHFGVLLEPLGGSWALLGLSGGLLGSLMGSPGGALW